MIAAIKQEYGDNLPKSEMIRLVTNVEPQFKKCDIDKALSSILTYYFSLNRIRDEGEIIVDFVHSSFKEYLIAEYYIEAISSNAIHRNKFKLPAQDIIGFLDGLLELCINPSIMTIIEENNLSMRGYITKQSDIEQIKSNAADILNHRSYTANDDLVALGQTIYSQ